MPNPLPAELIREAALQACRDVYGKDAACDDRAISLAGS